MGARSVVLLLCALSVTGCITSDRRPVDENRAVLDYINLAMGYLQEGYSERAIKPLKRALEIEPGSASAYGMLGMAYQHMGEDRLAERAFARALDINPDASDVRNNFGAFLYARERHREAYRQFELAAQDVSYPRRSRTFENMGIVALRLGDTLEAKENFIRALRLNSNLPKANLELAAIYQQEGNLLKSWQYYQVFEGVAEHSPRSLLMGIDLATANGARSEAQRYLSRLERLYPGSMELKQYRSRVGYE